MTTPPSIPEQAATIFCGGEESLAWLTSEDIGRVPLKSLITIGRTKSCDVVIADKRISRKHAAIHPDADLNGFWISDLGGVNGVYVNQRRIEHTTRLWHGDEIRILDSRFRFYAPNTPRKPMETDESSSGTMPDCRVENRWLMVADIVSSTRLISKMSMTQFPLKLNEWFRKCRRPIEHTNGRINDYAGDGFLADWVDEPGAAAHVAKAIEHLQALRAMNDFAFRFVVHFGEVAVSGVGRRGNEGVLGPQVHYTFRMEKVAGRNCFDVLISEEAGRQLKDRLCLQSVGQFEVPSFGPGHNFFTLNNHERGALT